MPLQTIQSIALMTIHPPPPPPADGRRYKRSEYPQVTLIVAPMALLNQWKDEIETHCRRRTFSVHIYHGDGKKAVRTARDLEGLDVVLCTYQAVMHSFPSRPKNGKQMTQAEREAYQAKSWESRGLLHRIRFWRLVIAIPPVNIQGMLAHTTRLPPGSSLTRSTSSRIAPGRFRWRARP